MGTMPGGLINYLAHKKAKYGLNSTPTTSVSSTVTGSHPMVPMSPPMVSAIKASPKGTIPAGLAKWLKTHKKSKVVKK